MSFSKEYWNKRYLDGKDGWDIGEISSPLKEYFKQLGDKEMRILIPGCGNAYEAIYLLNEGFTNVYVLDYSDVVMDRFRKAFPMFPGSHMITADFFEHTGQYDLIVEQTFFCALQPEQRSEYARQMHALLAPGGRLSGLLFTAEFKEGPPFGGTTEEYEGYFMPFFEFQTWAACYNSIAPRQGREWFMILRKK